jgi:PqqD family protein of HPr-rel-A system
VTAARATWRLAPGQLLAHRCWDGEYVLYNDLSGDTHLLGAPAFALLQALGQGPAAEEALAQAIGMPLDATGQLLDQLEALALAEYLPC